jgi:aminopeptidase
MPDPRLEKLAQILVHYSLEVKAGQLMQLYTDILAEELALAVYVEALKAGAHIYLQTSLPAADEIFFKHASDEQIDYISPIRQLIIEKFDTSLSIGAETNTRRLSGVNPERLARRTKANAALNKVFLDRAARGELNWCYTEFPTQASAQEADMSLADYREFVFSAGFLNEADPVALWRAEGQRQRDFIRWLAGRKQVQLKGSNIDLTFSIQGRNFVEADGRYNFPDGEIFTGPVEDSANGWVRFSYPAIYTGHEVTDVELWFENGKAVKEQASKGQELLTSLLDSDAGARYLGEWGIGTNYGIQRFTKNMLFDEKMGGTIHLALGAGYPETGSRNESGLHWDMLCDMHQSEIYVDGDLFYKDGKPVI